MTNHIFVSHSAKDDAFVKELRNSLQTRKLSVWDDARNLRGGDVLAPEIQSAIENARAFILVLSRHSINSAWVLKEVRHALDVQQARGDGYKVIPLLLPGIEPDALQLYFPEEPKGIQVQLGPGGLPEVLPALLAALGERAPEDAQPMLQPRTEPLEELELKLTDPKIVEVDGARRAQAVAELIYKPADPGQREVASQGRFSFTAPIGPIEAEELRWYLERYFMWPTGVFKMRAEKVEQQLPQWGQELYQAVWEHSATREVLLAWEKAGRDRRFTVFVDAQLMAGTEKEQQAAANEAATLLLGLPWELLHDRHGYLFQGAKPVLVRRRLPNRRSLDRAVAEPPIRILLVSPRPEDDRAGYIDHRVSALPLVTALETLGKLVQMIVLAPPTFPALEAELLRAREAGIPYHVVHFDGRGVFHREKGLGGLCFEDPQDAAQLEQRRAQIIDARELAGVIRAHRIPLFFLEACESAKTEKDPTASVAATLLDEGVASVVAMSHSVLVETARRFVESFYQELVRGTRVGAAMLAGQRRLKSDPFRLKIFGAGRLDLEDWFVPVLYQEQEDLQLLTRVPSRAIEALDREALKNRLGALPPEPEHQFIGRSRELLKLERLLAQQPWAVLCGQGGEGKTTLAAELARWLVRSHRFDRALFVCVEDVYDVRAVVDRLGRQLLPEYTVAGFSAEDLLTKALHEIERELRSQRTMIVLDNLESILPATGDGRVPQLDPAALETLWQLCRKLLAAGDTRLLFTSREALPAPFDANPQRVTLSRLTQRDAIELVHQTMTAHGLTPKEDDLGRTQPEIEELVNAVNCHARSLVLLAPYISRFGVTHTTANLHQLMTELHQQYPNERERSLFASVALSLHRLAPELQAKLKPLGVFQGGAHFADLQNVLELTEQEAKVLVQRLVEINLAEYIDYGFFRLHPALCPYLWGQLNDAEKQQAEARWVASMQQLSDFLYDQAIRGKDAKMGFNLTTLELPNLLRLLERVHARAEPEATVNLATRLEQLLAHLGRKSLLARVVAMREAAADALGAWSHAQFEASRAQIERLLEQGNFKQALQAAQALREKCLAAGENAYSGAAYDIAVANVVLGRILKRVRASDAALPILEEAYQWIEGLSEQENASLAGITSGVFTEKGDCLLDLGRLDEATAAYEAGIEIAEKLNDARQVAVGKFQLGTVRMYQQRYDEALQIQTEAREIFEQLGEPGPVAIAWHQIGMVHDEAGQWEAAERAYRQSLAIKVQQNNPRGRRLVWISLVFFTTK